MRAKGIFLYASIGSVARVMIVEHPRLDKVNMPSEIPYINVSSEDSYLSSQISVQGD